MPGSLLMGNRVLLVAILSMGVLSCNLQLALLGETPPTATAPMPTAAVEEGAGVTPLPSPAMETSTAEATATTTATSTAGPPPLVTVVASGGRLNVRRGPGPDYDIVGAFRNGQSGVATGRNQDGGWVLINAPDSSKSLGWITVKTQYTTVSGDVTGLPLLEVEHAVPAYIRNCTPHEMLVNPGGETLLGRSAAPENQLQFFPGEYTVIDQVSEDTVADITVFEGRTIDIKKDSSGKTFTCP